MKTNELGQIKLLPELKKLPKHPVFEIAENTPVFLINGKAYSLGEGVKGKEKLVEIGDFESLEALALDRAQLRIEKLEEKYAKEIQKELHSLKGGDGNLDTPQLIVKYVFPYLREGDYQQKVSGLLGLEAKKNIPADSQVRIKNKTKLEKIVAEAEIEINNLIREIETQELKLVKRTKKQSKLDSLLGYKEPEKQDETSVLGRVLMGRDLAIIQGVLYNLVAEGKSKKQIEIDGKKYSLVRMEDTRVRVEKPKKTFEVGDRIRMNRGANHEYSWSKEGSEGVIVDKSDDDGDEEYSIKFTKLTAYPTTSPIILHEINKKFMKNLSREEIEVDNRNIGALEREFLTELDKKVRVDALRKHFSKDKIMYILSTRDAELLEIAGKKEHREGNFGFVKRDTGGYYAYIDVPKFAIKSPFDRNYYLFNKTRVGVRVWKNKNGLNFLSSSESETKEGIVIIDRINHPMTPENRPYERVCIGYNPLPTSGKDDGEVIAKRLKKGKEIVMYGYVHGIRLFEHRTLGECDECCKNHYKNNIISKQKAEKMGVPIADGGRIKWQ